MILARIILGFLVIAPMTGYDLMRAFRSSAAHFWRADKAQIYRTLARLVDDGHARAEIVPGEGGPDRVVHEITGAGRDALVEWLASGPARPAERDEFLARVFFAESLDPRVLRRFLAASRDVADASLQALRDVGRDLPETDPATDRGAWLRRMTLEHGIRSHEMHIAWIDELEVGLGTER